jgi:hypothetical protein
MVVSRDDLHNIVDDRRHFRARSPTPPRRSPERAANPTGWGGFHAPTPSLRQVTWLDKFKPGLINKYDDFSNPEEFIQIYHMVIEATGGDDRVKVNYMLTTLSDVARS